MVRCNVDADVDVDADADLDVNVLAMEVLLLLHGGVDMMHEMRECCAILMQAPICCTAHIGTADNSASRATLRLQM